MNYSLMFLFLPIIFPAVPRRAICHALSWKRQMINFIIDSAPATMDDFSSISSNSELLKSNKLKVKLVALAINLQEIAFRMLLVLDSLVVVFVF